jgi:hypothetical protein
MNPLSPLLKNEADEHSLRLLILRKAESIGPSVTTIVENIWVRTVMTALYDIERFLKLADIHSPKRLEAASRRAIFHGHGDHRTVDHILMKHLDSLPLSHYSDIDGQLFFWSKNERETE